MRTRPLRALVAGAATVSVLVACSGPAPAQSGVPNPTLTSPSTSATSPSPTASAVGAAACARSLLDRMDPSARAGQLLMVGVPAANAASGVALVRGLRLGGVFLAGRSSLGVTRTRAAVDALQRTALAATGVRLEVATDQEGGLVQTLKGPGFSIVPSALVQGRWTTQRLRQQTRSWAAQLVAAGITLDLAPVADTVAPSDRDDNPPIGQYDREYGGDPDVVAGKIAVVVSAMRAAGLGATVKHFPGLGRVHVNTDTSPDAVDPVASASDPNLQPFAEGIKAGTTAVMVSSASYPRLDPGHLAMFSSAVVTGLLRQKLGWTGMVVTDDVGRAVAVADFSPQQRALAFIAAGGDVVLTVLGADAAPMVAAIAARQQADPTFAGLADAAAYRVLLTKVHAGLATCS